MRRATMAPLVQSPAVEVAAQDFGQRQVGEPGDAVHIENTLCHAQREGRNCGRANVMMHAPA